jgi:crotonobetainyl-CoA:carnitine CoA-transferase CaiB-like acyl-CoA transferase
VGSLVTIDDPDLGGVRTVGPQPQLSETPPGIRHLGRRLGADTEAVLLELGYDAAAIADLRREGVV